MSIPVSDSFMAFACVISPVGGHRTNLLFGWNLSEQLGQHGGVPYIAARDLNHPNFQCFLINSQVYFAPNTAFGAAHCPAGET